MDPTVSPRQWMNWRCCAQRAAARRKAGRGGGQEGVEGGCYRTSLSSPRVLRYRCDWVWVPLEAPLAPSWLDMVAK